MRKLNIYIGKNILGAILIVTAVIISIDLIFTFVAQFRAIGSDEGFTIYDAIAFVFLRIPSDLYLILPVCAFLGVLVGLGNLAAKSELIAMRSAGVSVLQIARAIIWSSLIVVIIGYLLAAYISPLTRHAAYTKRYSPRQDSTVLVLASATWVKSGDNIIYIGKTLPGGKLLDIVKYNVEDNKLQKITTAHSAQVHGQSWTLHDVVTTKLTTSKVTQAKHQQVEQKQLLSPKLLHILTLSPEDMSMPALYQYIQYRRQNQLDAKPYVLQLWMRIFQPISIIVMMLLAIPFVFGPLRSASAGFRLLVGIVVGFTFYIVNQFFGSFTLVSSIPAFIGASLPIILFALALLLMLLRLN